MRWTVFFLGCVVGCIACGMACPDACGEAPRPIRLLGLGSFSAFVAALVVEANSIESDECS
jgi:hypothetical protein